MLKADKIGKNLASFMCVCGGVGGGGGVLGGGGGLGGRGIWDYSRNSRLGILRQFFAVGCSDGIGM